ncbi:MAG: S66 peptidase family protein [Bacteroidota bacterium]
MKTPPALEKKDKIGIIAPARSISREELQPAIELFESWGLEVKLGEHIFHSFHQFAGKDEERAADLQSFLDDPAIKAIVCARGGYGTVKLMEHLNFDQFIRNPKWVVGYSDITVLHSYITQKLGIKTLHATMPLNITNPAEELPAIELLKKVFFGEAIEYTWTPSTGNKIHGEITGEVTGGNLSVLYSLRGTSFDIDTTGKILFIEDLDEYLYHIDRMLMNFKHGNTFTGLKALLVGGMTDMNDNKTPYGFTAHEIIKNITKDYSFPVVFDFPAGHFKNNLPVIIGSELKIQKAGESIMKASFTL